MPNSLTQAREALDEYKKTGNLDFINTPIQRFDVWKSVFCNEPQVVRELQIKEIKELLNDEYTNVLNTLAVSLLDVIVEQNTPLNLVDATNIVVDCMGKEHLPQLIEEAEKWVQRRRDITKQNDNEWIQEAQKILDELKKSKP
jgi:hypothetical protein